MYKNFHLRIYRFSQFPDNINNENLSVAILSLTSWSAWSNDKGLSWLPADLIEMEIRRISSEWPAVLLCSACRVSIGTHSHSA